MVERSFYFVKNRRLASVTAACVLDPFAPRGTTRFSRLSIVLRPEYFTQGVE